MEKKTEDVSETEDPRDTKDTGPNFHSHVFNLFSFNKTQSSFLELANHLQRRRVHQMSNNGKRHAD